MQQLIKVHDYRVLCYQHEKEMREAGVPLTLHDTQKDKCDKCDRKGFEFEIEPNIQYKRKRV